MGSCTIDLHLLTNLRYPFCYSMSSLVTLSQTNYLMSHCPSTLSLVGVFLVAFHYLSINIFGFLFTFIYKQPTIKFYRTLYNSWLNTTNIISIDIFNQENQPHTFTLPNRLIIFLPKIYIYLPISTSCSKLLRVFQKI